MPRLKRTREDAELDITLEPEVSPEHEEVLKKLRNMWEFASLMQYIYLFGHVVKIDDDFDIEDLEAECLFPSPSEKLANIGLQFLKYVSSHRGLTLEIFDEYTRRQYTAKAPSRNPFGVEEEPRKFNDMDIFTRIRVLHQLSIWTFGNAERIRGLMGQDEDHLNWRMEPLGWDERDQAYFVLDDNRLYRRSDEPLPLQLSKKQKTKGRGPTPRKPRSKGTRQSKRRKVEESDEENENEEGMAEAGDDKHTTTANGDVYDQGEQESGYGFTRKTWEVVAITLEEYREFLSSIFRSRDPNEKELRRRIEADVLPIIEKRAESLRQRQLKKMRDLENLQKMAKAKRSSRLANKADREKQEHDERVAEEKKKLELRMAHEEQERQKKIEESHESRRLTREQRLKEREVKRILHEEELVRIEEAASRGASQGPDGAPTEGSKRISERQLKTQKEQHQRELDKLADEEESWTFDCAVCGIHGENLDDGTHSVACEKCNVWQHSKCHGFSPKQAESDGFHFICNTCRRKEESEQKPRIAPTKLKNGSPKQDSNKNGNQLSPVKAPRDSGLPEHVRRQLDSISVPRPSQQTLATYSQAANTSSVPGHMQAPELSGSRFPPMSNFAPRHSNSRSDNGEPEAARPLAGQAAPFQTTQTPVLTYASTPHHQHHHHAHQQALVSSSGHPEHSQQHYRHHSSVNTASYPQPRPSDPLRHQPQHHLSQQSPKATVSPTKAIRQHQHLSPTSNGVPAASLQPNLQLQQSPKSSSQPPFDRSLHNLVPSPIKSSPPYNHANSHYQEPRQPPFQTPHTSAQISPSSANGHQSLHRTPQTYQNLVNESGKGVAIGGMLGPWPENSKEIPQKHDQSPGPPSSSHAVSEKTVVPPVAPLLPSPIHGSKAAVAGTSTVPVKKMPEANGAPLMSSPSSLSGVPHQNAASKLESSPLILGHAPKFADTAGKEQ